MSRQAFGFVVVAALWFVLGLWIGYTYPRDMELESLKPIEFTFEVTREAALLLGAKGVKGCPTLQAD